MLCYRWSRVYIYHTEIESNKTVINVESEPILVEKKGKKYKEIATGLKFKSLNIDLKNLESIFSLRTELSLKKV